LKSFTEDKRAERVSKKTDRLPDDDFSYALSSFWEIQTTREEEYRYIYIYLPLKTRKEGTNNALRKREREREKSFLDGKSRTLVYAQGKRLPEGFVLGE
jgi:hypothetical protein